MAKIISPIFVGLISANIKFKALSYSLDLSFTRGKSRSRSYFKMSNSISVTTYNVLSSSLASPDWFFSCNKDYLSSEYRMKSLQMKLSKEIEKKSIICLQEVSTQWAGQLHVFFCSRGYYMTTAHYGQRFNGYMGVAIAVPMHEYDILNVDITKIGDTKRTIKKPKLSFLAQILTKASTILRTVINMITFTKPTKDVWKEALYRSNQMISLRLKSKNSDRAFCIANYHMPCAFQTPQLMIIHSALSSQHIARFAKSDPYIFVGDFNLKDTSSMYQLLTTGSLEDGNPDKPQPLDKEDDWQLQVQPLVSAYKAVNGKEPDFTNFAESKMNPIFIDTIDYIFVSQHWVVQDVLPLPHRDDVCGPLPNKNEPSDHILLSATLTF